ncbi:MAG: flagellar hook-length control protein FliK [Gammaproteobacteria bacterium]|nr:flagellar hook-length control protein FliK [Gammaproteobacteria bacterium]MBQ0839530.1 flagellar hook-length control protein FliK [Gammaproteobacteria bacterium]
MPLSVQVAAPAKSAQMLTGEPSSPSTSSTEGGKSGERGFSSHLEAEKRSESGKSRDAKTPASSRRGDAAEKPATAGSAQDRADSAAATSGPEKGRTKTVADAGENHSANSDEKQGQASPLSPARLDAMANNPGLQNAPALGLSELTIDVPIATMGEKVLSLLAAEAGEVSSSSETAVDPLAIAAGGNVAPHGDEVLPAQSTGLVTAESDAGALQPVDVNLVDLKLQPADSELLAAAEQQVASQVSAATVAAALRQEDALDSDDLAALGSALPGARETAEVLTRPNPALTALNPELARALPGKQPSVLAELVDAELDVDLGLKSGKAIKPLLEGATPNPAIKLPVTTQVVAEALSNGSAPQQSFEQVRQNIMAAMAGKSELAGPSIALSGGADGGETVTQGLNVSSVSSALTVLGTESAKYSATQETAPPRFFTLQIPAGQPGWDAEVGNRIRWMVGQNNSGLELRLNPPELGSIEVKLATDGERTNVTFYAANPAAREALEAALPRLREMFADSGMQLANADVSDQGLQQEREQLSGSGAFASDGDGSEAMLLETGAGISQGGQSEGRGVIDYYI